MIKTARLLRRAGLPLATLAAAVAAPSVLVPSTGSGGTPQIRPVAAASTCHPGRVQVADVRDRSSTRRVWVYRPAVSDSSRLPVVYLLHGLPGSYVDFARAGLQSTLDRLACAGHPMVAAAPDGNAAGKDTEWGDAADGSYDLETFVTKTLIGAVEGSRHRPAADRALVGFSMGGFASMSLALRHRDLYGQVASLAGYFHLDDPDDTFEGNPTAHQPDKLLAKARGLRIYLAEPAGDTDRVTRGETLRFTMLLHHVGVHPAVAVTGGTHSLGWVSGRLPNLTAFLADGFR